VEFEATGSVTLRITVFSHMASFSDVETVGFCETSIYFYQNTRRHIPEGFNLRNLFFFFFFFF